MRRTIAAALVLLFCILALAGCNTIRGLGKDIERGGQAIERAAGGR